MNDPRGSVWRKWDLHVHTPASFHWEDGKRLREMSDPERDKAIERVVGRIRESDVDAFGIMDYWTFDGYLALRAFQREHPGSACGKPLFPGMELRLEAPVDFRLNIHVILSDEVSPQTLSDFKASLKLRISGKQHSLSDEALILLAKWLDISKAELHGLSKDDLQSEEALYKLGSMTAEITRDSFTEACKKVPEGAVLVVLPYDTSDGLAGLDWKAHPHSANEIMRMAHFFETRNPDNVNLFLGIKTEKNAHFIDAFLDAMGGRPKPVLSGSDAHKLSHYGVFPGGRATWLKADPTWPGLMSVVCEPTERSYIGDKPPHLSRVSSNSTKYIRSIEIWKRPESVLDETWFDSSIPINHGLVAVIGNKGSGKSALTDVIGLVTNSSRENWFPFLTENQFRQPGDNKARHFSAAITWEDGTRADKGLDSHIDQAVGETACYIPQNFFEVICNELAKPGEGSFDRELRNVIFSHVGQADRLAMGSLEELVSFRTSEIEQGVARLRLELSGLNREIASLEESLGTAHRKSLQDQLEKKQAELASLDGKKPATVRKPRVSSRKRQDLSTEMRDLKKKRKDLAGRVSAAQARQESIALSHSKLTKVLERLRQIRKEMDDLAKQYGQVLRDVGLDLTGLVSLTVKDRPILDARDRLSEERRQLEADLDPDSKESLAGQIASLDRRLKTLELRLDEPARKYERYQQELADWNQKRGEIKGTATTVGTLRYLQGKMKALDDVPGALEGKYREREDLAGKIHDEIGRIADIYRELYAPVQRFIESHPLAEDEFRLVFHVSIVNRDFQDRFFELVSHGVTGSFYGVDEGRELLRGTLAKHDFGSKASSLQFIQEIADLLRSDSRTGEAVDMTSQLRKGKAMPALYDLIFGLEYLAPRYVLRMGDRELHELSPGEKGTLLLLFYLLVDRSEIPLIIDQPEHNLDNETIYDLLVPAIREAKQRRQIIVVTHNPNIAVVCDADQVICASLDKAHGYRVGYEKGAIEDPKINRRIVEVLEGTMPAFGNRDSKYTLVAAARKRIFAV